MKWRFWLLLPGLYGLKHDIHDVTKLMDEPTLDELLRGTFDCPSLSKDKGKKTSNMSENFLSSVKKACSILHFPKSVQSQNMAEMDSSSNKKMSACESSSVCVVESGDNGDKGQSCATDKSLCQKVSTRRFQVCVHSWLDRVQLFFIGLPL